MPVTITDLAAHLQMPALPSAAADQAEMQRMLDAAADFVRAECGCAATAGATVLAVTASTSGQAWATLRMGAVLILPAVRFSAVTAVVDPDGNQVTPLRVDLLAGIIWVPVTRSGTWRVTVVFDDMPASLQLATLIIAAHLYETQRRPGQTGQAGGTRPGYADRQPAGGGLGFAVPNRAATLMAPYRLPGIA